MDCSESLSDYAVIASRRRCRRRRSNLPHAGEIASLICGILAMTAAFMVRGEARLMEIARDERCHERRPKPRCHGEEGAQRPTKQSRRVRSGLVLTSVSIATAGIGSLPLRGMGGFLPAPPQRDTPALQLSVPRHGAMMCSWLPLYAAQPIGEPP
jgi:hypothetical protein